MVELTVTKTTNGLTRASDKRESIESKKNESFTYWCGIANSDPIVEKQGWRFFKDRFTLANRGRLSCVSITAS